jgi:peptide deformylase
MDFPGSIRPPGDPVLRKICSPVDQTETGVIRGITEQLLHILRWIEHYYGRPCGIAAPQIGIPLRAIALAVEEFRGVMLNPAIIAQGTHWSPSWEVCVSNPFISVLVNRVASLSLEYRDTDGILHSWAVRNPATAAVVQHEIDHLDGVLTVDRMLDSSTFTAEGMVKGEKGTMYGSCNPNLFLSA